MGHRLRLGGHDIKKPLFERSGNRAMQLVAPAANQACVGGVLHKRVLELIRGIGRDTPLVDQLRIDELRERGVQGLLRKRGRGRNQGVGELTADDGPDLGDVLHRCQAVEPCEQGGVQR